MTLLRDRHAAELPEPVSRFDAFTFSVAALTFSAIAVVAFIALVRAATSCMPAPRPAHFAPSEPTLLYLDREPA